MFWALLFIIMILSSYIIAHIIVINSDAYREAIDFISSNDIVRERLGGNLKFKLHIFSGYTLKYTNEKGYAEFDLFVMGDKGEAKVNTKLNKLTNGWKLDEATLFYNSNLIKLYQSEKSYG